MPTLRVRDVTLSYEDTGGGGPPVLLAHGLLYSRRMWAAQLPALATRYRCIAYDHRGQGESEVTAGGYDMDSVAEDGAALLRALGVGPAHVVGLSMGGFVGMRLAARSPELVRSLVLLDTSADAESAWNRIEYGALTLVARTFGTRPVLGAVMRIMHGRTALADPGRAAVLDSWRSHLLAADRTALVRSVRGVIDRPPATALLPAIRCPTLVLVGDEDVATVPARSEALAAAIRGARLVRIPGAGHMAPIDAPETVTRELLAWLDGQPA